MPPHHRSNTAFPKNVANHECTALTVDPRSIMSSAERRLGLRFPTFSTTVPGPRRPRTSRRKHASVIRQSSSRQFAQIEYCAENRAAIVAGGHQCAWKFGSLEPTKFLLPLRHLLGEQLGPGQ